ncbi:hypothetical protein [Christiangramia sp. LLG6405-1]
MEIFTEFMDNYKMSIHGLNIIGKILVMLTLLFIFAAIVGAVVNLVIHTV